MNRFTRKARRSLSLVLLTVCSLDLFSQATDTLTFYSKAFEQERSVVVHLPEFYRYQAEARELPVIYVLDGQHEWFVEPVLTTIGYMQYTHEMPEALTVVIPLLNRNEECALGELDAEMPLHRLITQELEEQLAPYHPGQYRVLIGHSFSASFALYSRYKSPEFYTAVMAFSPMDRLEELAKRLGGTGPFDLHPIFLAIGGMAQEKDRHHRKVYEAVKVKYPSFFAGAHTLEADFAAHNAVPMVALPAFLTELFQDFSARYVKIAEVNEEYQLREMPVSLDAELARIREASRLGAFPYPPELPDINGIASRYLASGLTEYAAAVYALGVEYFPNYYEFYLGQYEHLLQTDSDRARECLLKAEALIQKFESGDPDALELLGAIREEREAQGW